MIELLCKAIFLIWLHMGVYLRRQYPVTQNCSYGVTGYAEYELKPQYESSLNHIGFKNGITLFQSRLRLKSCDFICDYVCDFL